MSPTPYLSARQWPCGGPGAGLGAWGSLAPGYLLRPEGGGQLT